MSYFEYGRESIALVPGEALAFLLHLLGQMQSRIENEVDELLQQGERQVAESLAATQGAGASGGGDMGIILTFVIVGLIGLVMIALVGRQIRKNRQNTESEAEHPMFEDQFAVHDEEIEILTEVDDRPNPLFREEDERDTRMDEPEPAAPTHAYAAAHDDEADDDEADDSEVYADEAAEEEVIAYAEGDEDLVEHDEDEPEHTHEDNENVIRLTDHTDQEPDIAEVEEDEQDTEEQLAAAFADHHEEETYEEEQQMPEAEEDSNVRYAFASTQRSPIAFSGISDDAKDEPPKREPHQEERHREEEAPSPRSYIAPTVLRQDMEKIERQQAARLDQLRDEMTRQISAMKSESNSRLDLIINSIDRKIDSLTEVTRKHNTQPPAPASGVPAEFSSKVSALQSALDNQGQRIRAITQILDDRLDSVSHVYGEVRNISERIEEFSEKMGKLEQSLFERAQQDIMADVQLSDVIRSCLSPGDYEFKALLSNNNRADCLIKLPHPPGAIVIDTKFPLDAFNALPGREEVVKGTAQAKAAEDSFRRSVLRHIIDVAERFIIPGETADSALLFLPTEAIYTTLHARFPDLVRDSFRARVWIVSPSTLMGTLQTLRGVLRDNRDQSRHEQERHQQDEEVISEMESLRSRASHLARNFEKTQEELRSLLEATDEVMNRGGKSARGHSAHHTLMDHLYDNKPEWPGKSQDHDRERRGRSSYDDKNPRPDTLR